MSAFLLSFLSPLVLVGLLALPLIWWLLRLTPPRPKEEVFPPTRILQDIAKQEETPAQSPWWLTLLRLLMAALVIFALAEPVWNAQEKTVSGEGPLLILLDNDWSSGENWDARKATAERLIDDAEDQERPVALVLSSDGGKADLVPNTATLARSRLAAAEPEAFQADLSDIAAKIDAQIGGFGSFAWLSNGLLGKGNDVLLNSIASKAPAETLYFEPELQDVVILTEVKNSPEALSVAAERASTKSAKTATAVAFDTKGRSISSTQGTFENGANSTTIKFDLPVELRNEIARISIADQTQAGATQLLDERFRRRRVGLISGGNADQAQPLLSPLYYISRALNPFSEVREADVANVTQAVPQLIEERISTLVLADIGTLPADTNKTLGDWVQKGGMLIRFAGPRLAGATDDELVPVELRRGGRSLGGTLTWGTPQPLASFTADSPFDGIVVPGDVTVTRQVLAEPGVELEAKTWASLADGTPLVTANKRGSGWIVLFHVTADASWSNLPLSGAFVDMLRRIVAVSNGVIAADKTLSDASKETTDGVQETAETSLPPLQQLNGFGVLTPAKSGTQPLILTTRTSPQVTLGNPPGLYGTSDAFIALNLFNGTAGLALLDKSKLPDNTVQSGYSTAKATALKPWFLAAAILLLALDCLAVLWMSGALRQRRAITAAIVGCCALIILPPPGIAQESDINIEDTLRTRLAYVITGDGRVDAISKKGLTGLTQFIGSRTSLEPGDPVGINISSDELSFYPLLYWPITTTTALPNEKTMARIDAFMKKGGSVLFDTRDQINGGFGNSRITPETQRLRDILSSLDIPPLEPVPDDHVLTRSFYLLNVFPGRYLQGKLWVEASVRDDENITERPTRQGDGVSSIMITSNDFAGAWAVETDGSPSLPIVPPNSTQRVYAYRTGVNIIMYTLTGNYKSDQVHIPALLERLGQ